MRKAQRYAWCGGPPTRYQKALSALAPGLLLGLFVYLAVIYPTLPENIPIRFNAAGEPTGWGGKAAVWLMPAFGLFMDLTFWLVSLFPQSWNTGTAVTVFNRALVYRLVRDLLAELRLADALLWVGLGLGMVLGWRRWMGWVLAGLFALVLVPLVRYFVRLGRARKRGLL